MSFTREINILNISGLVFISVTCMLFSAYFMNSSAESDLRNIRQMLTEERMAQLGDQVANAFAVAETSNYYEDAKKSIAEMRFGDRRQNSFYVLDGDGMFFVNETSPESVGKVRLDLRDTDGKEYVREIVKVAKEKEQGYISYRAKQADRDEAVTRLAYFRYFRNWNWIIYAAISTSDIDEKLSAIEARMNSDLRRQFVVMMLFQLLCLVRLFI